MKLILCSEMNNTILKTIRFISITLTTSLILSVKTGRYKLLIRFASQHFSNLPCQKGSHTISFFHSPNLIIHHPHPKCDVYFSAYFWYFSSPRTYYAVMEIMVSIIVSRIISLTQLDRIAPLKLNLNPSLRREINSTCLKQVSHDVQVGLTLGIVDDISGDREAIEPSMIRAFDSSHGYGNRSIVPRY